MIALTFFLPILLQRKMKSTLLPTIFSLWNVVSVSVTVSAETINQFGFRYRTETKIVVSVVHYLSVLYFWVICIVFHLNQCWPASYMKGIRILILDYASGQAKVQRILLIHTMSASAALQANGIHYDSVLPNKLVYQNKRNVLR